MSSPLKEPASTLRFGRYEVLFRIAAGGMAEVYAARMVGEGGFEKPVAVKRMLPQLAEDERFVQMFLDEGRLAAHISSPHVVQTLDLGRADDDSLYLVMELVVGVSLSALIRALLRKKSQLPVNVVVDILAQAAEGLHDAHEARTMYGQPLEIVHRDVSPQNILVDVSGRVRITDFGVARALERATHTQSGEVKGKIGYFAPEQVKGKHVDRRTDVFALGIVAWETLAGRRLFAGDNPAQTLDFVMSMPVPPLDALRADVPRPLAVAIAHALERDMDFRTQSAGDFAEELRRAMRPAGANAVSAIVREHGGESLMKLEEGLRAQSPSSLSRVRKAQSAPGASVPSSPGSQPSVPGSHAGGPRAAAPRALDVIDHAPLSDLDATRQVVSPPSDQAPTRDVLATMPSAHQAPTAILVAPPDDARPAPVPVPVQALMAAEEAEAPRSRGWVLVAATAAIGLVGAIGLGALWAVGRTPPEPTTIALPPVPVPAAPATLAPATLAPAAPEPEPAVAEVPPTAVGPAMPTPRTTHAGRHPDRTSTTQPRAAEPTAAATTATREPAPEPVRPPTREPEAEEPPRVATTTRPPPTRDPEPPRPPAGGSPASGSGGRRTTGLVGLGEFEEEIGQ